MRLLQKRDDGHLAFTREYSNEDSVPPYAVLSHTWLAEGEEVHFADVVNDRTKRQVAGWRKIDFCAERAAKDGLQHFWVDTCCIDRSSSAELQEAITTMFDWYRKARICYAYLADVSVIPDEVDPDPTGVARPWVADFRASKWFTRGWTLQELLAPDRVDFYSVQGTRLGDKSLLESEIHDITEIPREALRGEDLARFSIRERFTWAYNRQTTRREDQAYCLLGLFGVSMSLRYGEGNRAFNRLRKAIEKEATTSCERFLQLPICLQAAFNSLDNQYRSICLPQTRVELLQNIRDWVDGNEPASIFWLSGGPGTGKSAVACTIARTYHERGYLGASFFFSNAGGDASRADRLFTTIAKQLASRIPAIGYHIAEAVKKNPDIATHSLRDQWEQLILCPLQRLSEPMTLVIVVDALDECESEKDVRILLRLLAARRSVGNVRLRIFLTSRPEVSVRTGFSQIAEAERQSFVLEEMPPQTVDRDLGLFFEHSLTLIREERNFAADWPGLQIIKKLVEISCGLFIWASTACRYIREGRGFADRRMSMLIHRRGTGTDPENQLDEIYLTVLRDYIQQGYEEEEKKILHEILRQVIGSISCLCEPLSRDTLAALLDLTPHDIEETLADLQTVLSLPSNRERPIRLHHPTFREFITNKKRCRDLDFWIDEKQAHLDMATNCVRLMSKLLKRDICSLGLPGTLNKDISPQLIANNVPPELQYACCHWVHHYRKSRSQLRDGDLAHDFFQQHFLCWLEVMSLIGRTSEVAGILRMYYSLIVPDQNVRQVPLVHDARRFIATFLPVIECAPLQIYCSALAFSPHYSEIKQGFWSQMARWIPKFEIAEAVEIEASKKTKATFFVNHIAFTPDGRHLVSGSTEPEIRLYDVSSRSPNGIFERQTRKPSLYQHRYDRLRTDGMRGMAVSEAQHRVASGSDDGMVTIWDFETKRVQHVLDTHTGWVNCVAFSRDGRLLASGSMDESVRVFDVESGRELSVLRDESSCVNDVAFSPNGSLLASGSADKIIRLWDVARVELRWLLDGHWGGINSVRFSSTGKLLGSGSDDGTIKLWDGTNGTDLMTLKGHQGRVLTVAFSPDDRYMASGSEDRDIKLWDVSAGVALRTISGHSKGINAVAFSPDGETLASSSLDVALKLWNGKTGEAIGDIVQHEEVTASPVADSKENLELSYHTAASSDRVGHSQVVVCTAFSPDGNSLVSGSFDSTSALWTMSDPQRQSLQGHTASVNCVTFSANGKLVASSSSDGTAIIWDAANGSVWHILRGHTDNVRLVRFSPDGDYLASCSTDKTAIIWHTGTGALCAKLEGHSDTVNAIAFSPTDDQMVATCSADTVIRLWNISTQKSAGSFQGHSESVNSIAFSSDGELLLSSSLDTTVKIWDTKGSPPITLSGHTLPVNSAALSPNNKYVVSCADDRTVVVWDLEARSQRAVLHCDAITRAAAFSGCGRFIDTDRGSLSFVAQRLDFKLFAKNDRVLVDGKEFLWLPKEYQASTVATYEKKLVLGHYNGAISFMYL